MSVTAIEGVVENGQIRLPPTVHLPEQAKVYVIVPDPTVVLASPSCAHIQSPRLADPRQASLFKKEVVWEE